MAYSHASGGSGWTMVPCMETFLDEVQECVDAGLLDVTNLGQLGDAVHRAEPTSRHNPARAPNGEWFVCAADFGGPDYPLLAAFHQARYQQHDARLYRYGFSQRGDGYGLNWFDGAWKWTGRDQGHCHFDVNMAGPQLGANWWVPALGLTTPWGLRAWLEQRRGLPTTAPTDTSEEDDMYSDADRQRDQETHDRATEGWKRVMGTSPAEAYFVIDAQTGQAVSASKDTPGAQLVTLLTKLDGNAIQMHISQLEARVAAMEAKLGA